VYGERECNAQRAGTSARLENKGPGEDVDDEKEKNIATQPHQAGQFSFRPQ